MYIHNTFSEVNKYKSAKEYRKDLKELSSVNLRRNSKFNVMAVYGALKLLKAQDYSKDLNIYIASEYGCIEDVNDVLEQINHESSIVMPFSFLNINTNNTGYYISQELETIGNNINITAEDVSFEKALELAYFDFKYDNIEEIIIGAIDESLQNIPNHNSIIHNLEEKETHDGNSWFYLNNKKENSMAEIKYFKQFENIKELNKRLKTIDYDIVGLNQFAKQIINNLDINKEKTYDNSKDMFYGTSSASSIVTLLNQKKKESIYISLDSKQRAYLILFIIK